MSISVKIDNTSAKEVTNIYVDNKEVTEIWQDGSCLYQAAGPFLTFKSITREFYLYNRAGKKTWNGTLEYSTDKKNWTEWTDGGKIYSNNKVLYLRGLNNTYITNGISGVASNSFGFVPIPSSASDLQIKCIGNVENLLDYTVVSAGQHPTMASKCFGYLFGMAPLISAPELLATTLAEYCYAGMFSHCNLLKQAPNLPAITLAPHCYEAMFSSTSFSTFPIISATTMADYACYKMFEDCYDITQTPNLPATNLAKYCYTCMFQNCFSLTTIPNLPATTLPDYCYQGMFLNCVALRLSATQNSRYTIPYRIPFTGTGTSGTNSLLSMFSFTSSLVQTPDINTTYYLQEPSTIELPRECIHFNGGAAASFKLQTENLTKDWDGILLYASTNKMPSSWAYWKVWTGSSALPQNSSIFLCGISNTQIYRSDAGGSYNPPVFQFINGYKISCEGKIESLLDYEYVQNNIQPTMGSCCFRSLFKDCTALINTPQFTATTLSRECYWTMFSGCTSLTQVSALPATVATSMCYKLMFDGCTALTQLPALPATRLDYGSYQYMFNGCTSIKISATQTGEYQTAYRIPTTGSGSESYNNALQGMFDGTGGTFTTTPNINTTYYTSNTVVS